MIWVAVDSSRDPISKVTIVKWTGSVAQSVQHLLCKCEALRSNPNPNNKKITQERDTCSYETAGTYLANSYGSR
jgi:hypothetical protein